MIKVGMSQMTFHDITYQNKGRVAKAASTSKQLDFSSKPKVVQSWQVEPSAAWRSASAIKAFQWQEMAGDGKRWQKKDR